MRAMERKMNHALLLALVESSLAAPVDPSATSRNDSLAETETESSHSAPEDEFQAAYWAGVTAMKQLLHDYENFASLREIFDLDPTEFERHLERAFDTAISKSQADLAASLPLPSPTQNSDKEGVASVDPWSPDRQSKTASISSSGSSLAAAEVTPSPEWPKFGPKRP